MTSQDIRAIITETPFVPFRIRLIDGRSFDIPHRDYVWTDKGRLRTINVVDAGGRPHVLNTTVIVSIEFLTETPQPVGEPA